jgi:hypothetical protein
MRTIESPDPAALDRMLAEPGKHHLGSGLLLNVRKPGIGYWQGKYRAGGKERVLSIGKAPGIPADAAIAAWLSARDAMKQAPTMDGIVLRVVVENAPLEPAETLPRKFTRVTYSEHWDCGTEKHSHRSRETAQQCMEYAAKRASADPTAAWSSSSLRQIAERSAERLKVIRQLRSEGKSFQKIGQAINVSGGRVAQILAKAERLERLDQEAQARPPKPKFGPESSVRELEDLRSRTINLLFMNNVFTVGDLLLKSDAELKKWPDFGVVTRSEIAHALKAVGLSLRS